METDTKEKNKTRRTSIYGNEPARQKPIIQFEDVSKTYQNGVNALKRLSFGIDEGEFVFLMGSSGAGKSTLIKLILLEEQASEGTIYVHGNDVSRIRRSNIQKYRRSIGVFFQDFRLLERKTVYQNVAFAMEITGASRREIDEKVNITLSLMGLSAKSGEYPSHLSGGEQQRVALARAIVNGPDILIADEPTGNLDPENSGEIMDLLMKINSLGITVLVATHEQDMALQSGKRIIRLDHGNIAGESAHAASDGKEAGTAPSQTEEAGAEAGAAGTGAGSDPEDGGRAEKGVQPPIVKIPVAPPVQGMTSDSAEAEVKGDA